MKLALIIALCFLAGGCSTVKSWFKANPSVSVGTTKVIAPENGKDATIASSEAHSELSIPKGTQVSVTRTEAVLAQGSAPAEPAKTVTVYSFAEPAKFMSFDTNIKASSGQLDNTVAVHSADIGAKAPLLWASLGCVALAALFVYLSYPTVAILCGAASGIFFAAWKLADLPSWIWAVGAVAVAVGAGLYFGHRRGVTEPALTVSASVPATATVTAKTS